MMLGNYLTQAADINTAWKTLLLFMEAYFTHSTNILYPMFAITQCKIKG